MLRQGLHPASVTSEQHIRFTDSRLGQRSARACTPASVMAPRPRGNSQQKRETQCTLTVCARTIS